MVYYRKWFCSWCDKFTSDVYLQGYIQGENLCHRECGHSVKERSDPPYNREEIIRKFTKALKEE